MALGDIDDLHSSVKSAEVSKGELDLVPVLERKDKTVLAILFDYTWLIDREFLQR